MNATILFVPGLRDHVADHWQTLLAEQTPGSRTVPPLSENKLSRAAQLSLSCSSGGTVREPGNSAASKVCQCSAT